MNVNLTEADKARISEAIKNAESKTSGEIVPFLKMKCSNYPIATWKASFFGGFLALLIHISFLTHPEFWGPEWLSNPRNLTYTYILGVTIFAILSQISFIKRFLVNPYITDIVKNEALATFTKEQIFKTRERTGILIFIAFFEHRVEIIGDEGINSKVKQEEWNHAVDLILEGVKKNNLADGLVNAINYCGDLLHRSDVEIKHDDTNELENHVKIG